MRPLGAVLRPINRKAVGRKAMQLADLLDHWPDVVGRDFAQHTAPLKIIPGKGQAPGTLYVSISASFAPMWQHGEPQLLARINDYLGHPQAIGRVALKHQIRPTNAKPRKKNVGAAKRQELSDDLKKIENTALRDSLERLSLAILSRGK
ncbi:MAG: DciA family protein [Pseudomonadota bacterium]